MRYQVLDHLGTPRLTPGGSLTPDSRFCYDPSIPANLDKLVYCRMEGLLERYHFDPFGTPLIESHQKTGPSGGLPESIAGWTGNSGGMNAVANRSGDAGGGWDGPPLAAGGTGAGDWSGAPLAGENQTRFYSCQNGSENWCFTGKPREDAGDLFGARFYQYQHARWLSPDGPLEDSWIQEPQSWNLYQYVRNNPVNRSDPNGRQAPVVSVKGTGENPFIGGLIDERWWMGFIGSAHNAFTMLLGMPDNCFGLRDLSYQSSSSGFKAGQWAGVAGVAVLAVADGPAAAESGGGRAAKQTISQAKTVIKTVEHELLDGSFSILNWNGYPAGIPKPTGPVKLIEGVEYATARKAANQTNAAMHRADPSLVGKHIHEIKPVKFAGNPVDPSNKIPLTPPEHSVITNWWNALLRSIIGN